MSALPEIPCERELSYFERSRFGACPVCEAKHGEACRPWIGISLGRTLSGNPPDDGVHMGRLLRSPRFVKFDFYG